MNNQQLWQNIMNYGEFDRIPVFHWCIWDETKTRWLGEGLPQDADICDFVKASPYFINISGLNHGLNPGFEKETIEETQEYEIFRDTDGVIKQKLKNSSSLPHDIEYTFKTAKDWPEYKKRLQPNPSSVNLSKDWEIQYQKHKSPIRFLCGSLMGYLRNWMGVENMTYLIQDDPDVFEDYVQTTADLACWRLDELMRKQPIRIDCGQCWEDICGSTGPLISPDTFNKYVAPGYLKIRNKLEQYGIKFFAVDCDGVIEPLIKPWLDAGVNILYPVEIGKWEADPYAMRKKYGKELRLIGGYNKLVLEKGKKEIELELERRIPLIKEGGYIILPDHAITPDTPLDNYKYYLDLVRKLRI